MTTDLKQKIDGLVEYIRGLGEASPGVLVAYSGGVDSTLLSVAATRALGERALAVTIHSEVSPTGELDTATRIAETHGVRHQVLEIDWLRDSGAAENPVDRCYLCKHQLFGKLLELAAAEGGYQVLEGSQLDDDGDYRPGMRAIEELGVGSPLKELGFRKADVRACSRELGLETAEHPPLACLATRFPYGDGITREALAMVDAAEVSLRAMGFEQLRVRCHGDVARLELPKDRLAEALGRAEEIGAQVRAAGFAHVALDLAGYRSGSMNTGVDAGTETGGEQP